MREKILAYKDQAVEKWRELDNKLKIKISVIAIGLITILGLLIYMNFRPEWVVIKANSDVETIGQMEALFSDNGIESRLIDRVTGIEVKEEDLDRAKILIASSDLSQNGLTFDDVSSSISIGMTENDKQEQYNRLKEAELKRLIETFDTVTSASVMLALPSDTVIFDNNPKVASAGVTLTVTSGFTREQGATIANLIASSVEGITVENVSIADTKGVTLYSGDQSSEYSYSAKDETEKAKRDELESKIKSTLDPLFDEVKVISTLIFDWDKAQEKILTLTPPVTDSTIGVPINQIEEVESIVNSSGGVEPGIEANDMTPVNYATTGDGESSYDGSRLETMYGYNEYEQLKEIQGGTVVYNDSSVAITGYRYKFYDEEVLENNETINDEYSWDQFQEDNRNSILIELEEELLQTIQTGTGIQNVTITAYEKPIFIDKVVEPIQLEQIIVLLILVVLIALLAFALIKKAEPDDIEEVEPEISIEDLIATNTKEDEEVADSLMEDVDDIATEHRNKIEAFIDEDAAAVASLLRNWLKEDWG